MASVSYTGDATFLAENYPFMQPHSFSARPRALARTASASPPPDPRTPTRPSGTKDPTTDIAAMQALFRRGRAAGTSTRTLRWSPVYKRDRANSGWPRTDTASPDAIARRDSDAAGQI